YSCGSCTDYADGRPTRFPMRGVPLSPRRRGLDPGQPPRPPVLASRLACRQALKNLAGLAFDCLTGWNQAATATGADNNGVTDRREDRSPEPAGARRPCRPAFGYRVMVWALTPVKGAQKIVHPAMEPCRDVVHQQRRTSHGM